VTRSRKKWSEEASAKLQDCFASTDWNMFRESSDDIEEYTTSVIGFLNKCIDEVIPKVTIRTYPNQKPWITGNIRTELKARAATFKEQDSSPEAYKKSCYVLRRTIKQANRQYRTKIKTHYTGSDTRRMWHGLQTIKDYKREHESCPLTRAYRTSETTSMLASRQVTLKHACSCTGILCDHALRSRCKTFRQVNIHKATGPDGLPGRVL
jgi:hypothetical protein